MHSVLEGKADIPLAGSPWAALYNELILASCSSSADIWDQSCLRFPVPGMSGSYIDWNHSLTLSSGVPLRQGRWSGKGREPGILENLTLARPWLFPLI